MKPEQALYEAFEVKHYLTAFSTIVLAASRPQLFKSLVFWLHQWTAGVEAALSEG